MFLEDWRKLDLDTRLGWRTSDVLWWLFLSPDQEVFRRSGIEFMRLAVDDGDDALIRFGHSEAGEATGHVMLSNTARVAAELSGRTGLEYRYFGPYHLNLESGHVANTEGVFETVELDPERRERASESCERMFDIFDNIFDGFLHYATTYVDAGTTPRRPPNITAVGNDWIAPSIEIHPRDDHDTENIPPHPGAQAATARASFLRGAAHGPAQPHRTAPPVRADVGDGHPWLPRPEQIRPDLRRASQRRRTRGQRVGVAVV